MRSGYILALALCALLGGVVGFVIGRSQTSLSTSLPAAQSPTHSFVRSPAGPAAHAAGKGTDPLRAVLAIRRFDQLHSELQKLGRQMAAANLEQAIAAFYSLTNAHQKTSFLEGLIEVYARNSPSECLEFLHRLPPGICKNAGAEKALAMIVESDAERALSEVARLLRGPDAHNAYMSLTDIWAQLDPTAALTWTLSQSDSRLRSPCLEQVAVTWAQSNPHAALRAINDQPSLSPAEKGLAIKAVVGSWCSVDPNAALEWAINYNRTQPSADLAVVAFMNAAAQDPGLARAGLDRLADPNLSKEIIPAIASHWGMSAPNEAANWLGTLAPSDTRGRAFIELAESWSNLDPESATRWANQLPADDPSRADALRHSALTWSRFNQDQFHSYLNSIPLSESQQIRLILSGEASTTNRE